MDGGVGFKIVMLAAIMAFPAIILGAIWPFKATRWLIGLVYSVPAALVTMYVLPVHNVMARMVNEAPNSSVAGVLVASTISSFAVGYFPAWYGGKVGRDFAAFDVPTPAGGEKKER